ncbi:MAG: SDR family oxidoreductase [Deltaproteobacteria bacterium]|nr:SDR family oxidoreductase [Deltaproteobacteria bacterium]
MRLSNKVAFITGAGSGIGREIALHFSEHGAKIVIAEIVEERGRETASLIEKKGGEALFVRIDVSSVESIEAGVKQALERFGKIDVLVNNAGILEYLPFLQIKEKNWDRLMNINLKGTFFCAQKVAKEMIRLKSPGSIINLASIAAELAIEFQSHYVTSKGGVRMMTKGLALELAPYGIRVNAIAPGVILTEMTKEDLEEPSVREEAEAKIPLGRLGAPLDVARAALFFASDESDYITGSLLFVTGGFEISV